MGRGGYNGGGPVVKKPKINVDVFNGAQDTLNLPKGFQIVKAGEGLQNERGGRQAEFGYLICTKKAEANSPTLKHYFLRKRKKAKKNKAEYRWTIASVLLKDFPLEIRKFHHQNPDAPRPFGLAINEEAKE